ncbi:hypothetical protein KVT40_004125 [Elsinoe batatas]|uniref:N-acetyltransferase domain-containing protein n=1 Tax=Elsinoe batatas TaxID=2601811 RepID=A0A8K0L360_9PEZI|nr:hypothetical protein KVT40_004125 [Elsinoe batatas]
MPRQLPPDVRHRLIIEQITARQGKVQTTATFQDTSNGFLSPWNATDGALTEKLPGLKASKTFLSSLRTNLSLPDCPSPAHSPALTPQHPAPLIISSTLPPPAYRTTSTTSLAQMDLDAVPPPPQPRTADDPSHRPDTDPNSPPQLTTYLTTYPDERISALRLVADSVAQQRSIAARSLIFHPLCMAVFVALCGAVVKSQYRSSSDVGIVATTLAGVAMAALVGVRWACGGYIDAAEQVGERWIEGRDVWVSKYGEEIIGAVVVGWEDGGGGTRRRGSSASDNGREGLKRRGSEGGEGEREKGHARRGSSGKRRKRRAEIVAWTVRLRYRGKGIGEGLLEAVVDEAKARGGEVGFAEGHANSTRVLWNMFNSPFEKKEKRAVIALQNVWESRGGKRKR